MGARGRDFRRLRLGPGISYRAWLANRSDRPRNRHNGRFRVPFIECLSIRGSLVLAHSGGKICVPRLGRARRAPRPAIRTPVAVAADDLAIEKNSRLGRLAEAIDWGYCLRSNGGRLTVGPKQLAGAGPALVSAVRLPAPRSSNASGPPPNFRPTQRLPVHTASSVSHSIFGLTRCFSGSSGSRGLDIRAAPMPGPTSAGNFRSPIARNASPRARPGGASWAVPAGPGRVCRSVLRAVPATAPAARRGRAGLLLGCCLLAVRRVPVLGSGLLLGERGRELGRGARTPVVIFRVYQLLLQLRVDRRRLHCYPRSSRSSCQATRARSSSARSRR